MDEIKTTVIRYELTIEDHREMTAHLCATIGKGARTPARIVALLIVCIGTYTLVSSGERGRSFAVGMIVAWAMLTIYYSLIVRASRAAQRTLEPRPGGALLCSYTLSMSNEALLQETPTWRSHTLWSAFLGIEETKSLLLLKLEPSAAYPVPKRAFQDSGQLARFREQVELQIGSAVSRSTAPR